MKTTATPRALALLTLVLAPFILPSCQRSDDPTPNATQAVASNAAAVAPVPCQSEGYAVDANGVGAYKLPAPRKVNMLKSLTGLTYELEMTQVKYIITPSGKEQSVWQGTDVISAPTSKTDLNSSVWSECDKGYSSKCVRWTDGRVTLSLTTDANVLPHSN